jgi:hypothetical protein
MNKMHYYYGIDNFEKEESLKSVDSLKLKRKMVDNNERIKLRINNNLTKKNK